MIRVPLLTPQFASLTAEQILRFGFAALVRIAGRALARILRPRRPGHDRYDRDAR